jgi:hypothetical protein
MNKAIELARKLNKALIWDTRNNGESFLRLADGSPQWMSDVIYESHGDAFPSDTIYHWIKRSAEALANLDYDAKEYRMRDAIGEIESDIYTSELTGWLHEDINHVCYITDALTEMGDFRDGFQLLTFAQHMQIEEVGNDMIDALVRLADEQYDGEYDDDPVDERYNGTGEIVPVGTEVIATYKAEQYTASIVKAGTQGKIIKVELDDALPYKVEWNIASENNQYWQYREDFIVPAPSMPVMLLAQVLSTREIMITSPDNAIALPIGTIGTVIGVPSGRSYLVRFVHENKVYEVYTDTDAVTLKIW